jgi:hypothetical protein
MTSDAVGMIARHLIHRKRLTSAEEQWLDLDGDGRITSRDLLLARTEMKPKLLPGVVPNRRVVGPGEILQCTFLGPGPSVRVKSILGKLSAEVRQENSRRTRVDVKLPADAPIGPSPVKIWFVATGFVPRFVTVVVSEGKHESL